MNWIIKTLQRAYQDRFAIQIHVGPVWYVGFIKEMSEETLVLWDNCGYSLENHKRWIDRVILVDAITQVVPLPDNCTSMKIPGPVVS